MKDRIGIYPLLLIAGAVILVYLNSFAGVFIFDDELAIVHNPHLARLWPPAEAFAAPPDSPLRDRPVVSFSFSLNRAIAGPSPAGFHAGNLLIHLAAALLLYGVVQRALLSPRLPVRWRNSAGGLALASALLWAVHPLQTQSVTYITQRCESLMGFFFLATIYTFIRGEDSPRPRSWRSLSVFFCLLGMGSKAVMAVAPVMVLFYDRVFIAAAWREIWERRRRYYLALFCTLALQGALLLSTSYRDIRTHRPLEYALSQPGVIAHYLRLVTIPHPLCLDYYWPPARSAVEIRPSLAVICSLLLLAGAAGKKYPPLGFAALWFFLILTPTSSFLPLEDLAFEHRMYLPLAGPVVLGVAGFYGLLGKIFPRSPGARKIWGLILTLLALGGFGARTVLRNRDYHSAAGMWEKVIDCRPFNPRGHNSLANIVLKAGDPDRAIELYRRAIAVSPDYPIAPYNLANLLAARGEMEEALVWYRRTVELNPEAGEAHNNLGIALYQRGETAAARIHFQAALGIDPDDPAALYNLGLLLLKEGDPEAARGYLARAVAFRPGYPPAQQALSAARAALRQK